MLDRPDLAAMLAPLLKRLMAAELPVLERHGVSMWGYVVLGALAGGEVRTQAALADAIGADKTRIIATLDELQGSGLIARRTDPNDRRVRVLSITAAGKRRKSAVQAEIQRGEQRWLSVLAPDERATFLTALAALAAIDATG